jgi:flagellar biosynthetic protein FliQ
LREAIIIAAPVIVAASLTSLLVSFLQTLTSIQDQTISIVPRLLVVAAVILIGMPWYMRHLTAFTTLLLTNFGRFLEH